MQGPGCISIALLLVVLATAACSSSLPTLPPPSPKAPQTETVDTSQAPAEVVTVVPGAPTEIYAQVARGALRCWLGAEGPLRPTHVFHAEAESPAKGGAAEMVLHERDETLRDKRGARAFRVSFAAEAGRVRVAVSILKMEQQLALLMAKDVAAWARGGGDCEVRKHLPPTLTPVAGKSDAGAGKKR